MKTNLKLKKAIKLRSEQDNLRIKALKEEEMLKNKN